MPKNSSGSVRVFYRPFSREQVVDLLRRRLPALREQLPVVRVVLFGSCAQDRHTPASDIDVLIVYLGPHRADAYVTVRRTLGLRGVEPHVYSEAEYREQSDTVEQMVREGIVIEPEEG